MATVGRFYNVIVYTVRGCPGLGAGFARSIGLLHAIRFFVVAFVWPGLALAERFRVEVFPAGCGWCGLLRPGNHQPAVVFFVDSFGAVDSALPGGCPGKVIFAKKRVSGVFARWG